MRIWNVLLAALIGLAIGLAMHTVEQTAGITIIKMGVEP